MDKIWMIVIGAIFSIASGFVTWLSWKDSRAAFSLIAKLDYKIYELRAEVETMKQVIHSMKNNKDQMLNS